jgi:hypothetical protein
MTFHKFQFHVDDWLHQCFGKKVAEDLHERNFRFIEEALELVQSCGMSKDDVLKLVDYVYSRLTGKKQQEVGGVAVTLSALCSAQDIDLGVEAKHELDRIYGKIDEIRRKQSRKPHP